MNISTFYLEFWQINKESRQAIYSRMKPFFIFQYNKDKRRSGTCVSSNYDESPVQ